MIDARPQAHGHGTATYLGIDLAWSTNNRTGLATLDASGTLVASTSVRTDGDIDSFVEQWSVGRGVAAIDAPLIVANETGQRPCERAITAEFGAYHAGAHSSNRSKSFVNPPRGLTLSKRHVWDVDPASRDSGHHVAIEVYPHPAMITLFGLSTVLPYKRKRGRTVESCRDATVRLMDLMERYLDVLSLATSPRWAAIRDEVGRASRPMHLAAVEDEIDAIFCAYLAWLWGQGDTRMRVIGDVRAGYIVVPGVPTAPSERRSRVQDGAVATDLVAAMRSAVPRLTPDEAAAVAAVARRRGAR